MIVKNFELKKQNLRNVKFFLIYGNNKGLIDEIVENVLKPSLPGNFFKYDESELIKDLSIFEENILNKSFFENEKLIIVNRVSDKILNIIENIISKNISDLHLILLSGPLDKKSKIRKYFEKERQILCVPVYEDNLQTLSSIVIKFMREKNISISQEIVNIIVERAAGDRINLKQELKKIESYSLGKKKISIDDVLKITNLSENYSISDLVDNCLSKNKNKIIKILNENNFTFDDCIVILRTFLMKLKRLVKLHEELNLNKISIDNAVSSFKPPIFWKDKEVIKKQMRSFNYEETKKLMQRTNEIELIVKKYPQTSLNVTTDFV
ncbi:DNA polymerase III subunit delta, partial [Candidatus Pelagibacter sp.]|nr:DNA polymerase III subunit delta [Candidatus Pelagibacter sp.]MDC3126060.1 DNA polymerase III subunit delta [Candidatus Pelagibacter sp.]